MSGKERHAIWQGQLGDYTAEVGGFGGCAGDSWPNQFVVLDISDADGDAQVMLNVPVDDAERLAHALLAAVEAARVQDGTDPMLAFRLAMNAARGTKTN